MRTCVLLAVGLAAATAGCGGGRGEAPAGMPPAPAGTRASMAEIVAALRVALPLALADEPLDDPTEKARLEVAVADLREAAAALEVHGRGEEAGFRRLSRSLALGAEEIERRLAQGRAREARFLLGEYVDHCVGCHERFPGAGDSDLGARLYGEVADEELDPIARARLRVATRQFDAALEAYEDLLGSPEEDPAALDLRGVPADYLRLAVRVERDLPRARRTLEAFAARPDVPSALRADAEGWVGALRALEETPERDGDELAAARALLERGDALRRDPADRAGLVHDLAASALLHRYVARHPERDERTAEAYALLGRAELHDEAASSLWLSAGEFYLETAIRMAPGTEIARQAYEVLRAQTLADHSGSGGLHLAPEVEEWLDELGRLAGA